MERFGCSRWLLPAWFGLLAGCAALPEVHAPASTAFTAAETTRLGRLLAPQAQAQAPHSGVALIEGGADALRHRHALLAAAERAIDAQYYIWNSDPSGLLLVARLLEAADRGVRVRLLLDDFNVGDRDPGLVALASHANVEVRIFNPVASRRGVLRWLSLLGNLDRLSRRMHNKALLVDAAAAIVGGRNIGDEYFDLDPQMNFRDRDVLVVGPAVAELGTGFDGYWNHPLSVPIQALAGPVNDLASRRPWLEAEVAAVTLPYALPDDGLAWVRQALLPQLTWAPVEVLYERPGEGPGHGKLPLVERRLAALVEAASDSVLIESAYLVLRRDARDRVEAAVARGVEVRALTTSLASNDVLANHAGYARHRRAMLRQGLTLHEMRPEAHACRWPPPGQPGCGDSPLYGLHGKSAVFDHRWLFVGSFNLNPRSAYLNTELVLVIDSAELSARVGASIEALLEPRSSWRLTLDAANRVHWLPRLSGDGGGRREPVASRWCLLASDLLQWLPYVDHF
jgi:putative cardiolipin synthase